jgi:phage tail tape-measure protein
VFHIEYVDSISGMLILAFFCEFLASHRFQRKSPINRLFSIHTALKEWLLQRTALLRITGSFARRSRAMIMTNKLLPVALIAALVGGSVGALVMHKSQPATAETTAAQDTTRVAAANEEAVPSEFNTSGEQIAYKTGFADGFSAATEQRQTTSAVTTTRRAPTRVVYRNTSGSRSRASSNRVYYNYEPRQRSFWDKHRDKLTVAMGTGAGAAIGGLIGGKKGAAIGALSGAGGSALWTYKLRNRNRNY